MDFWFLLARLGKFVYQLAAPKLPDSYLPKNQNFSFTSFFLQMLVRTEQYFKTTLLL
jgi:hypothetical protein